MKKHLRIFAIIATVLMVTAVIAGCTPATTSTSSTAGSSSADKMYISVIAKGFQHQFWQVVKTGSEAAAKALDVEIYFTGPEGESAQAAQVDMLNAELAKNPDAICLAALNTEAVLTQLAEAKTKNIPVIGFDSGVPNAPAGQIAATAATDNVAAAALGAEKMFPEIKAKVEAATAANPVVISVISQDATSASVTGRTKGFAEKMYDLVKADTAFKGEVSISGGQSAINKGDEAKAAVKIVVTIGATADITDMTNAATGVLNTKNLLGVFCSNEGAVNGFLAALNSGSKIPAGCKVVGFDAGSGQKAAVKAGTFMGSITQDPYAIGYKAVELAVKAKKGEAVADIDTGAKWYDASNMDTAGIKELLYD